MKTLFKRRMTAAVIGKIAAFVAITAIALLASCTNPFFETLLSDREVSASGSSGGYRVRFAINDGTDTILDTKTTTGATLTDFPPDPKRAGYAFTGWNIAVDGSGNAFTVVTAVIADITVYAQWLVVPPGSYAVIFDRNDESGAIHRLLTVAEGNSLGGAFPGDPSRAGFGFAGWNTAADGSGSAFTVATAVWRDTKVYAQWGTYSYTVSFNKNGGDTEPSPAAVTVTSPATTVRTLPTLPIRPNPSGGEYSFAGWKTAPDGSESDFTTATVVPADITVYAHWVVVPPGSCAVVFHQNDETGLIYRHITVEQGHSLSALPGSPSRTGYVFSGSWNTKPDGSGDLFTGMDPIWSETHIYAQWGTYSYTVTFDGNGATTEASPATKTVASPATTVGALPTPPAKTGYLFGGWYDTTAGTGTPFTAGTPVTGTITVYAKWNNYTYTVTFAGNGATTEASPATKTVASPATTLAEAGMSTLPTPIRTGYDFKGWFPATNGSGLEFTSLTSVDADKTTVYAKWAIKTYTVTFNNNYGTTEPYAIRNVTYPSFTGTGTGTNFPADPPGWTEQGTGTKYIFNGWNTAANGSGDVFNAGTTLVIDPISVYAQWKEVPPNTYVVTFKLNDGNYGFHDVRTTDEGTPLGSANFPADPTREGYTFAGVWNTQANGQGTIFNAGTEVNADITVYAQWTAITYTVTFAGNGATTEASPTSKDVTRPVTNVGTLPAPPTKTGYIFGGWYDTTTGTGTEFTAGTTVNANKTVYAKWNSYSYTVTFDGNGATTAYTATMTVASPATKLDSLPATLPTRTGYSFVSWNTARTGTGSTLLTTFEVKGDIWVYAQWTADTYTVTFKSNYASNDTLYTRSVTVPATTTSLPGPPTRTGYLFGGWNRSDGTKFDENTTVSANITVHAKWNSYSHKVTFDSDGATTVANPTEKTVASPATTVGSLPTPPVKTGYTFGGWYTQKNGGGTRFTTTTPVTAPITVYANWIGVSYTVSFDGNGGVGTSPTTKTVTVTGTVPDPKVDPLPTPPTQTGYDFKGWNTLRSGGNDTTKFDTTTTVDADITVYAQWAIKTYTVIVDYNNGTGNTITVVVDHGTTFNAPSPTRTDYTFMGWNTAQNGTGTAFTASPVTGDITIYAQWGYTVTFDSNGGSSVSPSSKTVAAGASVGALPSASSRTEYTFKGWNTQADGQGTPVTTTTVPTEHMTVYAKWDGVTYTVTFDKNGGTKDASPTTMTVQRPHMTIAATSTPNLPTPPTRTNYTFTGWNDSLGKPFTSTSVVSGGMTVYAQWVWSGQFTISFGDAGLGAFTDDDFTISKNGSLSSKTIAITGTGYTKAEWFVDNNLVDSGNNTTIQASKYSPGTHTLTLEVFRGGARWSKEISFTVVGQ